MAKDVITTHQQSSPPADERKVRWKARLKKIGVAGFIFFLLKGIAWLVVGYLVISQVGD